MNYTAHETILDYMILSENVKQSGYPQLHKALELSWYQLFKKTKESFVRKWVVAKNGVVDYPKTVENITGVYIVDRDGDLAALYEDNIKNIIVPPKEFCKCNSCDTTECMCPTIKDNINQIDVIIQGITYTNKTVTRVLKNGKVVEETSAWIPKYNGAGVFDGVQQVSSQVTKCIVQILPCGCPVNNAENAALLFGCGCINDIVVPYLRQRYPAMYNEYGYYKLDRDNRQVYLFNREGKASRLKQVLIVFQSNGSDMIIEEYARPALFALLDWTRKMYSPSFIESDEVRAKKRFIRMKNEMIKYLNPIPYELMVETSDVRRKNPFYNGVHSDFIQPEAVCAPPVAVTNSTNISYSTTQIKEPLKGIVGDVGADNPVTGLSTFQNNKLIGLGGISGRIKIYIDDVRQSNWGQNLSFNYNQSLGTITFTNGYVWQFASSLEVDLNQ